MLNRRVGRGEEQGGGESSRRRIRSARAGGRLRTLGLVVWLLFRSLNNLFYLLLFYLLLFIIVNFHLLGCLNFHSVSICDWERYLRFRDILLRELPLANFLLVLNLFAFENDVHFLVVQVVVPIKVLGELSQLRALAQKQGLNSLLRLL